MFICDSIAKTFSYHKGHKDYEVF